MVDGVRADRPNRRLPEADAPNAPHPNGDVQLASVAVCGSDSLRWVGRVSSAKESSWFFATVWAITVLVAARRPELPGRPGCLHRSVAVRRNGVRDVAWRDEQA